jgi:thiol-disulfide isomerase/thioredoxin
LIRSAIATLLFAVTLSAATVPRTAPPFTVHLSRSEQFPLSKYRGKVVLLTFILTTCQHCQAATKLLTGIQNEYGPRGLQIVAAAINDNADLLVPDFVKEFKPSFPVGYSPRGPVAEFLQHPPEENFYVPVFVFIDKGGMIRGQYFGDDPFNQHDRQEKNIRAQIESLLRGAPVSSKKTAVPPPSTPFTKK